MNNNPYLELQAWNCYLAGPQMWNVEVAKAENAPPNSIYRDSSGNWQTMFNLDSDHAFRRYFESFQDSTQGNRS